MNDINNYIEVLLEWNPLYYSLLVVLLIAFVIHIINKYVVIPQRKEFLKKQEKLTEENAELMALFTELDPDPVIRVDMHGAVVNYNSAAKTLLQKAELIGTNIRQIIPEAKEINNLIETDSSYLYSIKINEKDFDVLIRGIKDKNFAQLYFHDITIRKNYEKVLKDYSEHLQHSIEDERKRIAKELHDGIGQNLSALRLKVSRLSQRFQHNEALQEIKEINAALSESIKELKEISFNLKPRILDEIGLESALFSLCKNFSKDFMINGKLKCDRLKKKINSNQQACLYRIVQEALTNIQKHSGAKEFTMRLIDKKSNIKLIITDDGKGFEYDDLVVKKIFEKSMGLISMRERAEGLGGSFKIISSPGEGTMITVEIPVEEK